MRRGPAPAPVGLHGLARAYGIQTAYHDIARRRREASPETLLAVLRALGAPVDGPADLPAALGDVERRRWESTCDPVVVAWDGSPAEVVLRLPETGADARIVLRLRLEEGGTREVRCDLSRSPTAGGARVDGVRYVTKAVFLPAGLRHGYHGLTVELGGRRCEALVIAAPVRAWAPPGRGGPGRGGSFFPSMLSARGEASGAGISPTWKGCWIGRRSKAAP